MNTSFGYSKWKCIKIIWIVFIILNTATIQSQLSFETLVKLDESDGLPNAQINCSHLDKMGYLWLGTKKGLFRYDGRSFQNPLIEDLIIGKNIKCFIQVDSLHFLVGTDYGIVKLNSLNFDYQYLSLENLPNANRRSNHIQEIRKSIKDQFWVVSTGGVFKISSNLEVQKHYFFKDEEIITASNLQPPRICEFFENDTWLVAPISSQNDDYQIYSLGADKIESVKNNPFSDVKRFLSLLNINRYSCLFLYENKAGKVVSGIIEIKSKKITYLETPLVHFQSHQPFFTIINDSLIGLDSKGFSHYLIFNSSKKKWFTYKKSYELDYLKSVHLLKENIIATTNQELFLTSNTSKYILNLSTDINVNLKPNNRFNYLECNGYKMLCNNNSITIANKSLKEYTIHLKDRNDIKINQLTEITKKEVLLSTNKGSYLLNLENLKIGRLAGMDKPSFFDTLTSKAFKFNNREIWFGFVEFKGLVKYSIAEKRFEHYPFNKKNENTFFHDVTTITNDDNGNLWLGWIGGGLAKFDTKNAKLMVQSQSNYKDVITCMAKDVNGAIWFGTNGYGIYRFHPDSMEFTRINKSYDPFISSITCDADNNVWFTNTTALIKFDQGNQDFLVLTKKHGITTGDFESIVYDKKNGCLIMGSTHGISIINESIKRESKIQPAIYVNRIYINNKRVDETKESLNLKYNENNIIIKFSIPNINNGINDKYDFSIDNNKSWQPCSAGEIALTGIKNGFYTVNLRICNDDNLCYQNEIIQINISTPFWKSFKFFALVTFLICLILYLFFRQRIYAIKKINGLKLKIARDLHDSIGGNLSSISFLSRAIVNKNLSYEKQQSIADKITASSIEAGNNIEEIIWNLQPKDRSVSEVINRALKQFEEVFENKNIQYIIELTDDSDKIYLNNLATINLLMVLKEIMNNIAKHSKAKNVNFSFGVDNGHITFKIIDNGIGFESNIIKGDGLENIQNRILEINGTLDIDSKINSGTKIVITLPY